MQLAKKILEANMMSSAGKTFEIPAGECVDDVSEASRQKAWINISNDLNKALVSARKFCRENKLDKEEKYVFQLMKDFIALDNSIQGMSLGEAEDGLSKMCDLGYHQRCKDNECECSCHREK